MNSKQVLPIPRRIRVGARMYSVDIVQSMQRSRDLGRIWYESGTVHILKRKPEQMCDTFWHEIVHAILYDMDSRLYNDEKFVTEFAGRLARAIKSAEFK